MGRAVTWLRCMRAKWKDWLVVVLLGLVLPVTEKSGTARRMEITEQMEPHIKFPFVRSTVPSQAVIAYGILGPTVAVTAHAYCARISPAVHHAATVGSLVSVLLSADITNVFKITVGRPRPNFFYRCFPDGADDWQDNGQSRTPKCHPRQARDVIDGYKSFPSGHTSWSLGSMFFLSLYLYHFLRPCGYPDAAWALVLTALPSIFGAWVGATRVIDYYHNASDVLAGGLIGVVIATLVFRIYFAELFEGRGAKERGGPPPRGPGGSSSVDIGSLSRNGAMARSQGSMLELLQV